MVDISIYKYINIHWYCGKRNSNHDFIILVYITVFLLWSIMHMNMSKLTRNKNTFDINDTKRTVRYICSHILPTVSWQYETIINSYKSWNDENKGQYIRTYVFMKTRSLCSDQFNNTFVGTSINHRGIYPNKKKFYHWWNNNIHSFV